MRFLLDENADIRLANYLRDRGHDVTSIVRDAPRALPDTQVIALAHGERRILITNDRDFGELIFRRRLPHSGVIYLRLESVDFRVLTRRLDDVLNRHQQDLHLFLVVTDRSIRVRQNPQ